MHSARGRLGGRVLGARFLDLVRLGRNSPARYVLGVGIILIGWFGIGFAGFPLWRVLVWLFEREETPPRWLA